MGIGRVYADYTGSSSEDVAMIGKLPSLDKKERVGWEEIGLILDGKPGYEHNLLKRIHSSMG
jgi:hypothetical protein